MKEYLMAKALEYLLKWLKRRLEKSKGADETDLRKRIEDVLDTSG